MCTLWLCYYHITSADMGRSAAAHLHSLIGARPMLKQASRKATAQDCLQDQGGPENYLHTHAVRLLLQGDASCHTWLRLRS